MHVMPKRSGNRQVGASSGLGLCNTRARAATAAVPSRPRHTAPPSAMERPSAAGGSPPQSPTATSAPHSRFGDFCSAISDTISVGTRRRHRRTLARAPHPLHNDRSRPKRTLAPIPPIIKYINMSRCYLRSHVVSEVKRGLRAQRTE